MTRSHGLRRITIPQLCFAILAWTVAPNIAAQEGTIDIRTPEGYVQANRKIHCSQEDGAPVVYTWAGYARSRIPGEEDRLLFQVEGMNIRHCVTVQDPERGIGYRAIGREIMLYKDPESGEVLRTWRNPWTGKTVEVIHMANDPLNQRQPTYGRDEDGNVPPMNLVIRGDHFFQPSTHRLFYPNPLGGDYQEYVGGYYHAAVIYNIGGSVKELLDPKQKSVMTHMSWVRMAGWLPWMEMGSRPGMMYFSGVVAKLESWDKLSQTMKKEIRANYPAWREPPPIDDMRPNESSWTYFKKLIDARRAKEKQEKQRTK